MSNRSLLAINAKHLLVDRTLSPPLPRFRGNQQLRKRWDLKQFELVQCLLCYLT